MIPWDTEEIPVRVERDGQAVLYVDFGHAACSVPEEFLVRDELGRVIGIKEEGE